MTWFREPLFAVVLVPKTPLESGVGKTAMAPKRKRFAETSAVEGLLDSYIDSSYMI